MFSCVWQWIHVFQRLALESYFPTYGIRFSSPRLVWDLLSRANSFFFYVRYRICFFALGKELCFSALTIFLFAKHHIRFQFSRVWQRNCFLPLSIRLKLWGDWHRAHTSSRLALNSCVPGRVTGISCFCGLTSDSCLTKPSTRLMFTSAKSRIHIFHFWN